MPFKLALSAGHYLYTSGKRCLASIDPNETREWWLNDRIADRLEKLLSEYDGIEILRLDDTTGQTKVDLATRSNASNNWGADLYLAIHHNAGVGGGSGGGITSYAYNGKIPNSTLEWQKEFYDELIRLTGLKGNRSTGVPRANLHECREPKADAILLELGFMDSTTDVPIILTQDFAYKCAQACCNVIVKKASLTKKSATTDVVGTYKVITTLNKYSSSNDAYNKSNPKGTFEIGTYYIYYKYPNGYNGMYNLTTDSTGKAAGSWINPAENVITTNDVSKIYRVRLSWDNASSQKGAFAWIENAMECCQDAGEGYNVYDWNGQVVYSYVSVKPEQEVVKKEVYDLDFPIKTKIIDKSKSVAEDELSKAIECIKKNNPDFDVEIANTFYKLAPIYDIDPTMAISQSILETGWFKFTDSAVRPEQHNYCGLGVTSNGVGGESFNTIENGVRAQLQHLYAYGCADALPSVETEIIDPRFKYVTRGIAPYWEQLAGRWAVPGFDGDDAETSMNNETTYGQKILKISKQILATDVDNNDVDDDLKGIDVDKVNTILDLLTKILTYILDFFKKKK